MEKVEKTDNEKRVARMDAVAEALLALVMNGATSEAQKGRLFQQVLTWYKVRGSLLPSGEGDKLKDMEHAIKSSGSGGKRNPRGAGSDRTTEDGKAIAAIIRKLPKPGNARASDGDTKGAQRESLSGAGAGGGIPADGILNDNRNVDGVGHLN